MRYLEWTFFIVWMLTLTFCTDTIAINETSKMVLVTNETTQPVMSETRKIPPSIVHETEMPTSSNRTEDTTGTVESKCKIFFPKDTKGGGL